MGVEAKESAGVYAICPNCKNPVSHGFQNCGNCGHIISANEQKMLQRTVIRNLLVFVSVGFIGFAVVFYILHNGAFH